jgi:hypothetical protein
MARIELRDATVTIKDGLAGTAAVNDMSIMAGDTTLGVDTVVLNTDRDYQDSRWRSFYDRWPRLARRCIPSPLARLRAEPTTDITFTPALAAGVANDAVMTFTSQQIDIKIGDGDLKYTEKNEYTYDKDRGDLDTVREGDEVPMEVALDVVYEHITTGTNESISPMDALKRKGSASEWVSSSSDLCEPYSVDIVLSHVAPCGSSDDETTTFPDFRSDQREVSLKDAKISVTGRCNATEPIVARS